MANRVWTDRNGFDIFPAVRKRVLQSLRAAGTWCVNNQCRHEWPNWENNYGRFHGAVAATSGKTAWAISWNTARLAQGLLAASRVLGKDAESLEDAADLGLFHDTRLQVYDPEFPDLRGAVREESVNCFQINPRDGMECSQGWIAKTLQDGRRADPMWLHRAGDQLHWTVDFLMQQRQWPMAYVYFGRDSLPKAPAGPRQYSRRPLRIDGPNDPISFCFAALSIPLCQYVNLTGDKRLIRKGAVPMAEWLVSSFFDGATGALRLPEGLVGHHSESLGGLSRVIGNDDGAMIALLCLHRLQPSSRWLDPVIANADWWANLRGPAHLFATVPAVILLMLDVARLTGERKYLDWVLGRLDEVFSLQCTKKGALFEGGFMGEDIQRMVKWLGCPAEKVITARMTSYLLIGLSKLVASAKTWSPAYSSFGW